MKFSKDNIRSLVILVVIYYIYFADVLPFIKDLMDQIRSNLSLTTPLPPWIWFGSVVNTQDLLLLALTILAIALFIGSFYLSYLIDDYVFGSRRKIKDLQDKVRELEKEKDK